MDVDRARAPTFRGRGRGQYRGNVAQTGDRNRPTNGACFQCGEAGHFARNCPSKQRSRINLIDFEDKDNYQYQTPMEAPKARVSQLKDELLSMSNDEREHLAQEMGVAEDFLGV